MTRKYFPFCFYVLIYALCVSVTSCNSSADKQTTSLDSITPLKIGDKVPEELWDMTFPVVSPHIDQVQYLSLGDFRDKLIILDFWATWCAPCISSLYKLDTLQQEFADDLLVFPTSYETKDKVRPFFTEKGWSLPTAFDETHLKEYFPHKIIPHQVWLRDGVVLAISSHTYTNQENIRNAINGENLMLDNKKEDLTYDPTLPLLIDDNGGSGEDLLYHSLITRYIPGMINSVKTVPDIRAINQTILSLYATAVMKGNTDFGIRDRIILEVGDSLKNRIAYPERFTSANSSLIKEKEEWLNQNSYCYDLILPGSSREQRRQRMLADLNDFFGAALGIKAQLEQRKIKTNVIIETNKRETEPEFIASIEDGVEIYELENKPINHLISTLVFKNQHLGIPMIAQPTIGNVSLKLSVSKLDNLELLREELKLYGLDIIQEEREMEVLVISGI